MHDIFPWLTTLDTTEKFPQTTFSIATASAAIKIDSHDATPTAGYLPRGLRNTLNEYNPTVPPINPIFITWPPRQLSSHLQRICTVQAKPEQNYNCCSGAQKTMATNAPPKHMTTGSERNWNVY